MSYVRSRVEQFENTSSKDQSSNAQSTGGKLNSCVVPVATRENKPRELSRIYCDVFDIW